MFFTALQLDTLTIHQSLFKKCEEKRRADDSGNKNTAQENDTSQEEEGGDIKGNGNIEDVEGKETSHRSTSENEEDVERPKKALENQSIDTSVTS